MNKNKLHICYFIGIIVLLIFLVMIKNAKINNEGKIINYDINTSVIKNDSLPEVKDLISKFLMDNKLYKSSIFNKDKIFFLPHEINRSRDYEFIAVNQNGDVLWKTEVSGFEDFDFVDINKDGTQELLISSDGGGNHPTCIYEFYRYESNGLFKGIDFKSRDYNGRKVNCGDGGNLSNTNEFTEYVWNHMYPDLYNKYLLGEIVLSDYPDNSPILCQKEKVVYKYDGLIFTEKSREIIKKNVNGLDYLRTCIN